MALGLRRVLAQHLRDFSGVTLLVTHDALDAATLADRVLVLDRGVIAQYGTTAEVSAQPLTEHVARLAGLNVVQETPTRFVAFSPSVVTVALAEPTDSPRLRWHGVVSTVTRHGSALRIAVATDEGLDLLADLTPEAVAELEIADGAPVWLAVKATAVRRYSPPPGAAVSPPR
nr:TOBE domain-containing protein [Nocardioides sp. R-C-SC26]